MANRILPIPGVYSITCTASGKVYVGSSSKVSHRWNKHRRELTLGVHGNQKLQRAWDKYGKDAFTFLLIEGVSDRCDLLRREQYWIDTLKPELNILAKAGSCAGRPASEKQKSAASAAQIGKPKSAEYRKKISESLKGRKIPPDVLAARKTNPAIRAHLDNLHNARRGVAMSDEQKLKIGAALRGRTATPEQRKNMSEARKRWWENKKLANALAHVV